MAASAGGAPVVKLSHPVTGLIIYLHDFVVLIIDFSRLGNQLLHSGVTDAPGAGRKVPEKEAVPAPMKELI